MTTPPPAPACWEPPHQRLFPTGDGSLSLREPHANEAYHNVAGAYGESLHCYALPAVAHLLATPLPSAPTWHVADVCFGLGYNSFTFLQVLAQQLPPQARAALHLWVFELDESLAPCWPIILRQTYYGEDLKPFMALLEHNIYYRTQRVGESSDGGWQGFEARIGGLTVHWHWVMGNVLETLPPLVPELMQQGGLALVFHDAFCHRQVPHLWEPPLFGHYAKALALPTSLKPSGGALFTYSRSGLLKETLADVGLQWQGVAAPLGRKRGGSKATHPLGPLLA